MYCIEFNSVATFMTVVLNRVTICFADDPDNLSDTLTVEQDTLLLALGLTFFALALYSCILVCCCHKETFLDQNDDAFAAVTRRKRPKRPRHLRGRGRRPKRYGVVVHV